VAKPRASIAAKMRKFELEERRGVIATPVGLERSW
jgi:hypothetical protein